MKTRFLIIIGISITVFLLTAVVYPTINYRTWGTNEMSYIPSMEGQTVVCDEWLWQPPQNCRHVSTVTDTNRDSEIIQEDAQLQEPFDGAAPEETVQPESIRIPKNTAIEYSESIVDNPYNNELIVYQKDDFIPLQYDKTKQVIDETFLDKTVGEWQNVSHNTLMQEHEKYLPEHKFFDHLGAFLIKNEFQNMMNELDIVNVEDDFEVKGGMSLTSLPPHNSYYSIIKATDGHYYRFQGGTHANQVNIYQVSALLFFDTSVDFKMNDLVRENQLFTIMPESNNNPRIEPHNLITHTNNSKVEFHNNTPQVIRIQDSGTGTVGEEHLLDWVGPTILPYTTASMTFDKPGNFDFNARFAPNLENPLWWSSHTSGTIIVMSDDMSSVSREEKNKMAQSLLFDLGLPVVGAGTGNRDNVLSVTLDPSVVESIPNATQYYKQRIEQIFPFEIVVVMD